jgi:hypothetical protein
MSLSVHRGIFNSLAPPRPRDALARLGRIVELDRSVERGRDPYYVSPDTLPGSNGVNGAGPTA